MCPTETWLGYTAQRSLAPTENPGREIKPVLIEYKCIIIFESVDPKSYRDSIQWVQAYGLLFHHLAHLANISWRDEFVLAAIRRRIIDSAYLQANQRGH